MAQAPLKSAKSASGGRSNGNGKVKNVVDTTKKGARVAKPKSKKAGAGSDKVLKKYTSGLTAMTERTLGARVGHLELLGGAKRKGRIGAEGKGGKKSTKVQGDSKSGGTKKFG